MPYGFQHWTRAVTISNAHTSFRRFRINIRLRRRSTQGWSTNFSKRRDQSSTPAKVIHIRLAMPPAALKAKASSKDPKKRKEDHTRSFITCSILHLQSGYLSERSSCVSGYCSFLRQYFNTQDDVPYV